MRLEDQAGSPEEGQTQPLGPASHPSSLGFPLAAPSHEGAPMPPAEPSWRPRLWPSVSLSVQWGLGTTEAPLGSAPHPAVCKPSARLFKRNRFMDCVQKQTRRFSTVDWGLSMGVTPPPGDTG